MSKTICPECERVYDPPTERKERAVIEAARLLFVGYTAWHQAPGTWHTNTVLDVRLRRLFATVEALLAAEGEE